MPGPETLAAPTLPAEPENKWRREQNAFRRLLPDLLRSHRNQYVAVHEGEVVESGHDKIAVAKRAYARYGYVPIFVTFVSDETLPLIRMPSPRLLVPDKSA
jgi:hypothetical protein